VNHPNDSLPAVVDAFSRDRAAGAVFVVDEGDHLLGYISERSLDFDLVTLALPEPLWPSLREFDTRDALRAIRGKSLRARELMEPARSIKPDASLKDALALMIRTEHTVVALVDDRGRLLGYLTLFEILAHLLRGA
jgi:CBS domain-containing protein